VHAKWLFVFLALVFSLGFIFLGIGSGSTGISQIVENFFSGTSSSGSSLASLQKKTQEHPKDAAAWLAYANKLQQKNQPDNAAQALTTYTQLKPKDTGALLQLAGLYLQRASDWQTLLNASNARTTAIAPTYVLSPPPSSKLAQGLQAVATPLSQAVTAETSAIAQNEQGKVTAYLTQRVDVYKKLAAINPQDATTQLSLATAAIDASDTASAIAAYKAFLKLAPNDSQAPTARKTLKQLESQQSANVGGGGVQKINEP
jgi:cytochrome c-type biogenesis protein CcmH/NrfG